MKLLAPLSVCLFVLLRSCFAQSAVKDESVRYQQERMVFLQWDKNKFTPKPGFLSLNPYYWLTWGFFHPNYHKKDLRPLSAAGPQTQRLALAGTLNQVDQRYKIQSDTVRNTALSQVAAYSGLVSGADPLWRLYYSRELKPVLTNDHSAVLVGLPSAVKAKMINEGLFGWYTGELDALRERLEAARKTMAMTAQQENLKKQAVPVPSWTPQTDLRIANEVLQHVK